MPTISKVLAATEFSEDSSLAFSYAEDVARKFGAEIVVLHVDQPLAPVMVSPELGPAMDVGAMSTNRRRAAADGAARARQNRTAPAR